jgi:glutamate formiminotransferase
MQQLIEYLPNFSKGGDLDVIRQITDAIEAMERVSFSMSIR